MMLAAVLLLECVLGWAIARVVASHRSRIEQVSLAPLFGLPAASVVWLLCDVALPVVSPVTGVVVLAVTTGLLFVLGPGRGTPPATKPFSRYELPFVAIGLATTLLSVWLCSRLPILARDMIVGPDLVATYAAAEGRIDSVVFSGALAGELSNQPFYAPFTMLMQFAGRLSGSTFGTEWLSLIVVGLVTFVYLRLRDVRSPVFAGVLFLAFLHSPLMFTYSHVALTDYPTAAFLAVAAGFASDHRVTGRGLAAASIALAAATWTRSDTLLIVPVVAMWAATGRERTMSSRLSTAAALATPAIAAASAWHLAYIPLKLDGGPATLLAMAPVAEWGSIAIDVTARLADTGRYGVAPIAFVAMALVGLVRRDGDARTLVVWGGAIVGGLVAVVILFPAASIEFTVKRGMMKLVPLATLAVAMSRWVAAFDAWLVRRIDSGLYDFRTIRQ